MSSWFLGVSVYLLEWFLSVEPEAATFASLESRLNLFFFSDSPGLKMLGEIRVQPEDWWPFYQESMLTLCTSEWCFFWRTHDPQ